MPIILPEPVAAYFDGKSKNDIDAMIAPLDDDAIVTDEGREYRGRAEIRAWMEEAALKYRPTVEVKDAVETNGITVVSGLVAGDFPGSPVVLRYIFTLAGTTIRRLEIDA